MEKLSLEEIRVKHIGKEYEISGEIAKVGKINTKPLTSEYQCSECENIIKALNDSRTLASLTCPSCNNKKRFIKLPGDEETNEQTFEITDSPKKISVIFPIKIYVKGSELINKFKDLKKKSKIRIIGEIGAEPGNKTNEKFIIFAKEVLS